MKTHLYKKGRGSQLLGEEVGIEKVKIFLEGLGDRRKRERERERKRERKREK